MKYLILFCFLMCSCSKIETGLNFAPRIASSKIDDAFDFNSDKVVRIRKQIDADLQKSKKSLALKIISHIEFVQKQVDQPNLTLEQIITFFDQISVTQTAFFEDFKPTAELVFKDLSEHEIQNFKKYSDKKYEEELELAQDRATFVKKKRQLFVKNYEIFVHDVTLDQERLITNFIERNYQFLHQRILNRQKFADEFYFKTKSKEPILDIFLSHYQGRKFSEISDPNQKEYFNQLFLLQISFWKMATDKQKSSLKKTLNNYKEELIKIANKSN